MTVDSDRIDVVDKNRDVSAEYDIVSTLIEIDMQSIMSLLGKFKEIISSGGRNVFLKDFIVFLDTMINDVRRLYCRSPTLFRMATRSIIAKSRDTRYGVDFGNVFATMTTSEGTRIFIERSIAFYTSLDESSTDQEIVRPKFLQMLVMLLALLNDSDLESIRGLLENTFKIPGNRKGIELLILKVLPLSSINSKVFMEDLLTACNHTINKDALKDPKLQIERWQQLQQDLANQGYILPVLTRQLASDDTFEDDLEALMARQELEDGDSYVSPRHSSYESANTSNGDLISQYPRSWMAPWPQESGIHDSTIFRHIQHCGKLKKDGNFQQETVTAVNKIPYLDITSEDRENEYVAIFANGAKLRVRAEDSEYISAMKKDKYTLKELQGNKIVDLEIEEDLLNEPIIEATKQHNYLVETINDFLGGRKEKKKNFFSKWPPSITLTRLEEPTEATRVWAELVPQSGDRQLCAEAFKLGDRIVFREDILRSMNDTLSRLKTNIWRIEKAIPSYRMRNADEEISRMQDSYIAKLTRSLDVIKTLRTDALFKRQELLQREAIPLPADPIKSVIYTSFIQTSGEKPEWQQYVTRLHSDRERLIVQSKKLKVENVTTREVMKLEFHGAKLTLTVQPLTPSSLITHDEAPSPISDGDTVLWLGYYVVHVEPAPRMKNSYIVQAYYRVLLQKREHVSRGKQSTIEKPQVCILI